MRLVKVATPSKAVLRLWSRVPVPLVLMVMVSMKSRSTRPLSSTAETMGCTLNGAPLNELAGC